MSLIPSEWEPIGHKVGPIGPDEMEVRENPEKSLFSRQWEVRLTARPDEVSVGRASQLSTCNLSDVDDIKRAIARHLNALIPEGFDKDKGSLPESFVF